MDLLAVKNGNYENNKREKIRWGHTTDGLTTTNNACKLHIGRLQALLRNNPPIY